MKRIFRHLPLLVLPLLCVPFASAQSQVDFGVGFGSNHSKRSNTTIDFGDGPVTTSSLGGFFLNFGGNVMLYPRFGVGMEASMQPTRPDYAGAAGVQSRTTFYDFNAIFVPVSTKRASVQLLGGIGGVNMKFYYNSEFCSPFSGCESVNQLIDKSNHFALHGGAAVQLYVTDHVFIRPQFDIRYVPNFFQYGSNWVPGGAIWVGYSLGDR